MTTKLTWPRWPVADEKTYACVRAVLEKVAQMSDWKAPRPEGRALGLSLSERSGSIGAGVAINYAKIRNEAILPAGASVTANGATIEALMNSEHELGASATSGAGGGAVGIAGSVAIEIENIPSENPKTGRITALSVLAALRKLQAPLRVGT